MTGQPRDHVPDLTSLTSERVRRYAGLARRSARERAGLYLVEGLQGVTEALRFAPDDISEVLVERDDTGWRHTSVVALAQGQGVRLRGATAQVLDLVSGTQTQQGVVAVVRPRSTEVGAVAATAASGGFLAVMLSVRDPGNAGTVIRAADAAGATGVVLSGDSVDPYNPKVVRSTAGSLFHLPVARGGDPAAVLTALRGAGMTLLAADVHTDCELPTLPPEVLAAPHAWVFGNEAWGLPAELRDACDHIVRIPIYGRAESLNLAMAATLCLYASAAARH